MIGESLRQDSIGVISARKAIADLNQARLNCYLSILGNLDSDVRNEAMRNIDQWESKGLCWSGYISGWRDILASKDPAAALLSKGGELNAFLQNSPLSFCMSKKAYDDYAISLMKV